MLDGLCQDERGHFHEVLQEVEPQAVVGEIAVYKHKGLLGKLACLSNRPTGKAASAGRPFDGSRYKAGDGRLHRSVSETHQEILAQAHERKYALEVAEWSDVVRHAFSHFLHKGGKCRQLKWLR